MIYFIVILTFSALLYVLGDYLKNNFLRYTFKPLSTIIIIVFTVFQNPEISELYKYLIITGFIFSLAGDIFIMLPNDKFIQGIGSFFIAHIIFIIAFANDVGLSFNWLWLIPLLVYAGIFLKFIFPKTGELKIPVIVYTIVIIVFLWQAIGRCCITNNNSGTYALIGAILFVVSDSILAYTRFLKEYKVSSLLIHSTYWGALFFLSLSV
jgi:uncharacterized membrane protein YhhN